jgi:endonuclease/exonuclease/phosphatase family metal-dependent hydrolase
MARIVRKLTKRIFIIINLVVVILFLFACLNGYLHPERWWFFSLLGLIFPLLLFLVFGFLVFWALFRSRWITISVVALIVGFTNIRVFMGFHFATGFEQEKKEGTIRILTWNVAWFDEQNRQFKRTESYRKKMLEFIKEQDADILCFQEYLEPGKNASYSNEKELARLNYPYHYRVIDYARKNGSYGAGVALFSRFPILDTFHLKYPGPENMRAAESLIACDLDVHGQTIRIFTTHLQSVLFRQKDYRDLQIIKNAQDSMIDASRSIINKLKRGYTFRGYQADLVREYLDESPHPEIICGDFNDVPNSYTYFRIKGDRQDVFIRKGSGVGRTFSHISPTLRIDYILADKAFKVQQYKRFPLPYSDHYPVVADVLLPDTAASK